MDLIRSAEVAKKIGRIAQLEERCPYKAEVTGSIPVPPTIRSCWYAETGNVLTGWRICSYTQELIGDQRFRLVVLLFCQR